MKQWWRDRRPYLLSGIIYAIARSIWMTVRLRLVGWKEIEALGGAKIFCGWHGRSFVPANFFKGRGVYGIFSLSRDGEMQTRVFRKLGFGFIRGSTGRGGERALVESIRVLRDGAEMAITPDGPRGPIHIVQGGVMVMAKKTGCALIPVGTAARPAYYFPSWDDYMIPLWFGKVSFVLGDPIFVPKDSTDAEMEEIRLHLQEEIHRMQAEANRIAGVRAKS